MTDASTQAVRIGGPPDLLDALPRMLGYVPTASGVLVALRPPRDRVGLTMRLDLPPRRHEPAWARLLAGHAQRAGATSAILVRYDDRPASGGSGWRGASLTREMRAALRQAGRIGLTDSLAVRDGRWRSLLCKDPGCCPVEGQPLRGEDDPSAIVTALVAEGAARAFPTRDALAASLAGPEGVAAQRQRRLQESVAEDLATRIEQGEPLAAMRAETVARFRAAVDRCAAGASTDDIEAARLVAGLVDIQARDIVLTWAAGPDARALLTLLMSLAARVVGPLEAPALTVLAWVAHAHGDGTLANIAVERALGCDPDYTMARLVAAGLDAGLHPEQVRAVCRELGVLDLG